MLRTCCVLCFDSLNSYRYSFKNDSWSTVPEGTKTPWPLYAHSAVKYQVVHIICHIVQTLKIFKTSWLCDSFYRKRDAEMEVTRLHAAVCINGMQCYKFFLRKNIIAFCLVRSYCTLKL